MPCLKPPKREGECAPSVRKGRCRVALHWAGTARTTSPLDGNARTCTTEPEETKHPVLQRRYLFSERSVVRGWQDSRAVHDSRGLCSEKSPFLARSSRRAFPEGGLRGISDAWRAYPAIASSFRMHGARILPRTGDFPVRGRFRDAWSAKIATDCRLGTHRGGILPRQGPRERIARAFCHCQSGQERIRAQSCHRRTLGNASCEHFAIVERPGNAYSQRLANRAASSCGRAYCLAIALVPHESDGLFVQAVLCT